MSTPAFNAKYNPNTGALIAPTAAILKSANAIAATGVTGHNDTHTEGASIASAGTVNLDSATGYFVHITGTTTITAMTLAQGNMRVLFFENSLQLTAGGSFLMPGGGNITTQGGDVAVAIGEGSSVTRIVWYQRADGTPLTGSNPFNQSLNTNDSVDFSSVNAGTVNVSGNLQFGTVGSGADSPATDGTYPNPTSITISNGVITAIS